METKSHDFPQPNSNHKQNLQPLKARWVLAAGALLAMLSVLLGAFATHGLKAAYSSNEIAIFATAARYQMYHALALFGLGILAQLSSLNYRYLKFSAVAFIIGILLFSGSLYLLILTGFKMLGAVTPFGGLTLVLGWGFLLRAIWQIPDKTKTNKAKIENVEPNNEG